MLYSHTYIHTHSTKMTYRYQPSDLLIYKAALRDDWNSVRHIFDQHPEVTNKTITPRLETPLMIAVGTNCSHRFVWQLLERFKRNPSYDLDAANYEGNTALHYAAKVGNVIDAKRLVDRDGEMPQLRNSNEDVPLMLAASLGRKDMLQYLLGVTLFCSDDYGNLITLIIQAGFIDMALVLVELDPAMVLQTNWKFQSALQVLATKPEFFSSGSNLGFWGHLVYSLIHVNKGKLMPEKLIQDEVGIYLRKHASKKSATTTGFWRVLHYLAPPIKNIYDIKVKHIQTSLLVERMCQIIIEKDRHDIAKSAIATAVRYGACELIEEFILAYPSIIWYNFEGSGLFHSAIKQRQEKVYNLVYQMTSHKAFVASYVDDKEKENALHIAAKLAPPHRLNIITGAALQMQRQLQWFKEVENLVPPSYKEALNKKGKTPRMVFTNQHKGLLREGQQWMKDTASSCTVVAALIVTVAFAAAFTVPGGNKDDGKPMFLNKGVFMLFIISDAIALFSSSTSLLMFLGILTSRYAEDDFLYALPKRMTIGLVSLFLSLATTLIAFSATLALVLQDKVAWIAAPLVIMTSIPVCLFGLLQFPLLMELVYSTYGKSIFRKQNDRMIH